MSKAEEKTESFRILVTTAVDALEPFNIKLAGQWPSYFARFEFYLLANDVQGTERQRATFLTLTGAALFDLLMSLVAPKKLPNEGFAKYVASLRKLAVDCNFGPVLDRMLRDRIVSGLRDETLQRCLLAEGDLQLQRVIDRATNAEAATTSF